MLLISEVDLECGLSWGTALWSSLLVGPRMTWCFLLRVVCDGPWLVNALHAGCGITPAVALPLEAALLFYFLTFAD